MLIGVLLLAAIGAFCVASFVLLSITLVVVGVLEALSTRKERNEKRVDNPVDIHPFPWSELSPRQEERN